MVINHNISALNTYNKLSSNTKATTSSLEKLSSGLRINKAGDDAAGLAISQKMQAQINGLDQASSNAQNGISLIQTAEGALTETQSILQRINTLATQSANDTNTTTDRSAIQSEVTQLTQEIDRIANTTQFNTKNLLNGGAGVTITQTGAVNAQVVSGSANVTTGTVLDVTGVTTAKAATVTFTSSANAQDLSIGSNGANITLNGSTITIAAGTSGSGIAAAINAQTAATGVKATYTASTAGSRGILTFQSSSVGSAADVKIGGVTITGTTNAATDTFVESGTKGQLVATDTNAATILTAGGLTSATEKDIKGNDAVVTASNTGLSVTAKGNVVTFSDSGATKTGLDGLQLDVSGATGAGQVTISANNGLNLQIGSLAGQSMYISVNDMRAAALGVDSLDLTTTSKASTAITTVQAAIDKVSTQRATLGAYQNRLDHTINNLSTESQNLSSASSQITDVDMAKEMTEFTKNNILTQAAQAMLAQANQLPQGVLSLLKS